MQFFRNIHLFRVLNLLPDFHERLVEGLGKSTFQPCAGTEMSRSGWVSPKADGNLWARSNGHYLLRLRTESRLLPASVIAKETRVRAAAIEEREGHRLSRGEMRELKDAVTVDLIPKAFTKDRYTYVWFDPNSGRIAVDTSSQTIADDAMTLLTQHVSFMHIKPLCTVLSPVSAMTAWLANDEAPAGFTIDRDTELRSSTQSKAAVRYVRHALEAEDMRRHIEHGKQCTRLALTWRDRISFTLTEQMTVKRITPLDVLTEQDNTAENDEEQFDADLILMTSELSALLHDLVFALGGQPKD